MKTLFLALTILNSINAFSQSEYFEGILITKETCVDAHGNDVTKQYLESDETIIYYYINSTNYKSVKKNGQFTQLYNSRNNKYYYLDNNKVKLMSASYEHDTLKGIILTSDTLTILGMKCKSALIQFEKSQVKVYYSEKVGVDIKPFMYHDYGAWNDQLNKTNGAISLRSEMKFPEFTRISETIEIIPMSLKKKDFKKNKCMKAVN